MFLLLAQAHAADVVLRNDTNTADTYDASDQVAWLDFPECAISVFQAEAAQLPLSIETVQVFLGSNTGNQDGDDTTMDVSLQILEPGEDPTPTHMEWGPETFAVGVTSTQLNELPLVDEASGLEALSYTSGRLAVWVCPPDPATGESWPRTSARDTSGLIIDTESPDAGNWLYVEGSVVELSDLVGGSWIIRAIAPGDEGGGGDDTGGGGGDDTGDGGGDDTGSGGGDGSVAIASVTPASASVGEPVDIAVLGSGFQTGASVFLGGLAVSNVALSGDTALSGTTPSALPVGTHDLVVTNPDGSADTLEAAFIVAGGCGCAASGSPWGVLAGAGWGLVIALRRRERPPRGRGAPPVL